MENDEIRSNSLIVQKQIARDATRSKTDVTAVADSTASQNMDGIGENV